jgi:hypothetical protein
MTHVQSRLWYRASLTSDEIAGGALTVLCERFALAVREAGEPEGACLFAITDEAADSDTSVASGEATALLFFSPQAIAIVPLLLATCGARPSDAPQRPRASLLVGRPADWQLLPCATH